MLGVIDRVGLLPIFDVMRRNVLNVKGKLKNRRIAWICKNAHYAILRPKRRN